MILSHKKSLELTNKQQFYMVYSVIDHRNDAVKMFKTLERNHPPTARVST